VHLILKRKNDVKGKLRCFFNSSRASNEKYEQRCHTGCHNYLEQSNKVETETAGDK